MNPIEYSEFFWGKNNTSKTIKFKSNFILLCSIAPWGMLLYAKIDLTQKQWDFFLQDSLFLIIGYVILSSWGLYCRFKGMRISNYLIKIEEDNKRQQLQQEKQEEKRRQEQEEKERQEQEEQEKQEEKERQERKELLISRFGEEDANKILYGDIWIDMTKEMLIESWGSPEDTKEDISRNKVKLRWYYGSRETRQGTTAYKHEVRLENDIVEGWKELE